MSDSENQKVRVVVLGVGAITAQGAGVPTLWENVQQGKVAIAPVKNLSMAGLRTALGGEIDVPAIPEYEYAPGADREPAVDFALVAAQEAMAACGLLGNVPAERWGVVYGSCNGGLVSGEAVMRSEAAGTEADWRLGLFVPPQAAADAISAAFGLRGPVISVNTACASGAHAIAHASQLITSGHADVIIAGGSDSLAGTTFAGFNSLESLAVNPAAPYSKERDGLSLGEGAGMLVLAREDVARAAGATMIAEVLGYGLSADGYDPTAPHPQGEGAARAIRRALATADVDASEVGYINGHGTGTAKNDPAEVNAVRAALGPDADRVALSSTKSMIGHLLGAAGAVESIVTVMALRDGIAPPTAGYGSVDPHCAIDVVPNRSRAISTDVVASNNFAFAGANACVVFGHERRARSMARGRRRPPAPPGNAKLSSPQSVVITGISALSPAGTSPADLVAAYRRGGLGTEPEVSPAGLRLARVNLDANEYLSAKQRRRMDRLGIFAVAAAQSALADAGLSEVQRPAARIGVVLGTGLGPLESMERFVRPLIEDGPGMASPAVFPNTVYNAAAGQVGLLLGLTGVTSTITVTHAAGACAATVAHGLLSSAAADVVVCLAVDTLSPAVENGYGRIPLFAGSADGGYTLAEGGYAIVLERREHARERGAQIRAEFSGYGIAADGLGVGRWDREGGGLERAIRVALTNAGLQPGQVSTIWANRAGLEAVDAAETSALGRVFGVTGPPIEAPKRLLGEPVGAGAQLSTALVLAGGAGEFSGPVLINSSSLGGTHAALVLSPPKEVY